MNSFLSGAFYAAASAILLTLAFPGPGLDWLCWVALVPLMVALHGTAPRRSFYLGLTTGVVHFVSLLYWIVPTIRTYGGIPLVLCVFVLALLAFYLALYVGIFSVGMTLFPGNSMWMPVWAGVLWVGGEYLRASFFTGFPWGLLGHCLYQRTTMIQVADLTGVYGISFVIVVVNAALARVWILGREKTAPQVLALSMLPCLLALVLVFSYGRMRQAGVALAMDDAQRTRVSVIQGNISQADKWDDQYKESTVDTYCDLVLKAAEDDPDLIVFPETALPFYYGLEKAISDRVDRCIRQAKTWFIVGSPALKENSQGYAYYNRAYMIDGFSVPRGQYDKIHLVPFGEYVPLGRYLPFLGKLTAQAGNFSSGDKQALPLEYAGGSAGMLICFEVIFPGLARDMANRGAKILVTITNDAWFGRTSAPVQHFSMAVFRAVENRRAVVRAANTGISGFIDPLGNIDAATDLYTRTSITRSLAIVDIITLYSLAGDWFAVICIVAIALGFMVKRKIKKVL
ncbi:MAG: apolipoprotein N-acyltransferase [Desulfobacterium sp.]|nr:apolipoprotein N-acyltransferase [Desulfobacterium sp.]